MLKAYHTRIKGDRSDHIYVDILRKLTGEKLYRDPSYNATRLADDLGVNRRYISAAVAAHTDGGNFTSLVSELRLREVCRMLTSPRYVHYTAEEIGLTAGFSSRQTFYTAFRRKYGITPRQYRRQHSDTVETSAVETE